MSHYSDFHISRNNTYSRIFEYGIKASKINELSNNSKKEVIFDVIKSKNEMVTFEKE